MRTGLMAGASRFASFAGLAPRGRRAEDDDKEDKSGKGGRAAEEDDEHCDDEEEKSSKRGAEDDDKEKDAAEDDQRDDSKSGKRGRAADDDDDKEADEDDDDREMSGNSTAAKARRRERARCAEIFAHPQAAADPELACLLAFETTMTRRQVIARLNKNAGAASRRQPSVREDTRTRRSERNPELGTGGGREAGDRKAQSAGMWDQAHAKAAGGKRNSASAWDAAHKGAQR